MRHAQRPQESQGTPNASKGIRLKIKRPSVASGRGEESLGSRANQCPETKDR